MPFHKLNYRHVITRVFMSVCVCVGVCQPDSLGGSQGFQGSAIQYWLDLNRKTHRQKTN